MLCLSKIAILHYNLIENGIFGFYLNLFTRQLPRIVSTAWATILIFFDALAEIKQCVELHSRMNLLKKLTELILRNKQDTLLLKEYIVNKLTVFK